MNLFDPNTMEEYLKWIVEPQVKRFCGPVFFITSDKEVAGHVKANGSYGLVDTGSKKLLVTCHHVFNEFRRLSQEFPVVRFALQTNLPHPVGMDFKTLMTTLVDEDRNVDLATFNAGDSPPQFDGMEFYNLHVNKPPQLEERLIVYAIGFPGKYREEEEREIGFAPAVVAVKTTRLGQSGFFADVTATVKELNLTGDDFGGFSGAPAFTILANGNLRLIGFVVGFGESQSGAGCSLQFAYAKHIQPDGMIRTLA